ncbi:hypothetical protein [Bdellovibrio bacteriovorus]|uniref:hypothetical protein n=1 Tax=Bdellovibrio bacteriovorus TaxID=959 RepID=UPI0035A7185F
MILLSVILVSVLGAQATFYLIHERRISTVRASSGPTLLFALIVSLLPITFITTLQAAFFGSTFVGMTDKSRMGKKRVLVSSVIFALIYSFLVPLAKGIGGGLGAAAFVSCAIVFLLAKIVRLKTKTI